MHGFERLRNERGNNPHAATLSKSLPCLQGKHRLNAGGPCIHHKRDRARWRNACQLHVAHWLYIVIQLPPVNSFHLLLVVTPCIAWTELLCHISRRTVSGLPNIFHAFACKQTPSVKPIRNPVDRQILA